MFTKIKSKVAENASNIPGWRTNRKIVVIESDDWGMIRMASKKAYTNFAKKNYPVQNCEYNRNDALESNDDLELLLDVLQSVKDINGNSAILTTNNIVANPDFEKIKAAGFKQYYYEPFTETLSRYPAHDRVMALHREGIENKLLQPQLHGREHVNVTNWMKALQQMETIALDAFEENMFTVSKGENSSCKKEYLDSFGTFSNNALQQLELVIKEAADLFEKIWGFRSSSIIAPCYTWHPEAEKYFYQNGIRYIQGGRVQNVPNLQGSGYQRKRHYTGQQNKLGQIYLVRNAVFEPCSNLGFDWVGSCLKEIKNSFLWGKPAIISSHRVNFIGYLNSQNRSENLNLFTNLLKNIKQRWPQVEFLSSDQLGDLINSTK
jgi:hypothetical protein